MDAAALVCQYRMGHFSLPPVYCADPLTFLMIKINSKTNHLSQLIITESTTFADHTKFRPETVQHRGVALSTGRYSWVLTLRQGFTGVNTTTISPDLAISHPAVSTSSDTAAAAALSSFGWERPGGLHPCGEATASQPLAPARAALLPAR